MPQQHPASIQGKPRPQQQAANGRLKQQNIMSMFAAGGRGPSLPHQRPPQQHAPAMTQLAGQASQMHQVHQQPLLRSPPVQQPQQGQAQQRAAAGASRQFKPVPLGASLLTDLLGAAHSWVLAWLPVRLHVGMRASCIGMFESITDGTRISSNLMLQSRRLANCKSSAPGGAAWRSCTTRCARGCWRCGPERAPRTSLRLTPAPPRWTPPRSPSSATCKCAASPAWTGSR